jgi:geranylgeranyl pyrophosphate synthase
MERNDSNPTMNAFDFVKPDIRAMEDLIRVQVEDNHPDLAIALELLLSSGGKRVRPTITILAGKSLNADYIKVITMAAAIELLHTATLVHDDLIDESLLRRGSPTLNSQWTPGATVLTGDFLFASAAKLASETNSIEIMKLFSKTLRTIVNGEVSQMFTPRCKPSLDEYQNRIYAKTASLFETSALSAGIISESSSEITQSLAKFGREIGMAFQITDDILDFNGDSSILGKPVGNDLRQGLVTLPAQFFFDDNPKHPLVKKIVDFGCLKDENELKMMIELICNSSSINKSFGVAEEYIQKGISALSTLPGTIEKQMLIEIALSQVHRDR